MLFFSAVLDSAFQMLATPQVAKPSRFTQTVIVHSCQRGFGPIACLTCSTTGVPHMSQVGPKAKCPPSANSAECRLTVCKEECTIDDNGGEPPPTQGDTRTTLRCSECLVSSGDCSACGCCCNTACLSSVLSCLSDACYTPICQAKLLQTDGFK
jgi:hypothetical protein